MFYCDFLLFFSFKCNSFFSPSLNNSLVHVVCISLLLTFTQIFSAYLQHSSLYFVCFYLLLSVILTILAISFAFHLCCLSKSFSFSSSNFQYFVFFFYLLFFSIGFFQCVFFLYSSIIYENVPCDFMHLSINPPPNIHCYLHWSVH